MALGLSHLSGFIDRGTVAAVVIASALIVPAAGGVRAAGTWLHSAAPCMPAGHGPGVIPAIAFGRKLGNILPFSVAVYADGNITYKGITPAATHYAIRPDAVLGLERLAAAEGFATWPTTIAAGHMMPDAATLFITLRAGCSTTTRTVNLQGGAEQPSFNELFYTLEAATALAG
jgi:hypothetical protein